MAHLYVGLDVHRATTSAAVLDGAGKQIVDSTLETKASTLLDFVRGLSGTVHLTPEEGTQADWLYDLFRPHVAEAVVCDPRQNRLLQAGNKADALDARKLAQLLRAGLLTAVYHGGQGARALKELVRNYECLVSDSTRVMNRIKALLRARGIPCSGTAVYRAEGRDRWLERLADGGARRRAEDLYKQLDCLAGLRREARLAMIAGSRRHPASKWLRSVPTLGPVRVAQLIAQVVTPFRFRSKRQFWAYAGLAVVTKSSADYRMVDGQARRAARQPSTRGLNRDCNRRLKQVFKAAALSGSRRGPLKPYYDALVAGGLRAELARLTLARKIAAMTLAVWKQQEAFDPARLKLCEAH
jgi:transposase